MLECHPHAPPQDSFHIEVEAARAGSGALLLDYRVTGDTSAIVVPPAVQPVRKNDLWQHTCFEAFIRVPRGGYFEFNFSPSGEWAAYRFKGYRSGRSSPVEIKQPRIEMVREKDSLDLRAELLLNHVPELTELSRWKLGLSVILEDTRRRRSFWAVAHPAGEPDFHHSDCFALELAAPSGA